MKFENNKPDQKFTTDPGKRSVNRRIHMFKLWNKRPFHKDYWVDMVLLFLTEHWKYFKTRLHSTRNQSKFKRRVQLWIYSIFHLSWVLGILVNVMMLSTFHLGQNETVKIIHTLTGNSWVSNQGFFSWAIKVPIIRCVTSQWSLKKHEFTQVDNTDSKHVT